MKEETGGTTEEGGAEREKRKEEINPRNKRGT